MLKLLDIYPTFSGIYINTMVGGGGGGEGVGGGGGGGGRGMRA